MPQQSRLLTKECLLLYVMYVDVAALPSMLGDDRCASVATSWKKMFGDLDKYLQMEIFAFLLKICVI